VKNFKVVWLAPNFVEVAFEPDFYASLMRRIYHVPGFEDDAEHKPNGFLVALRTAQLNLGGWRSQRFATDERIALLRESARTIAAACFLDTDRAEFNRLADALMAPPVVDLIARIA